MKKNGFTLSEVMLTIIILGVVSSLIIPSFMSNTHKKENIAGYHRALNVLNKAYSGYLDRTTYKDYNDGTKIFSYKTGDNPDIVSDEDIATRESFAPKMIGEIGMNSAELILEKFIKKNLSIIKFSTTNETGDNKMYCPDSSSGEGDAIFFYTQDGMRYCMVYSEEDNEKFQETTYGVIWVDVNGNHGPNSFARNANEPKDTFPIIMMKNRFIPGHPTDTSISTIAEDIYFGKKGTSSP